MRQWLSAILATSYIVTFACGLTLGMLALSGCGGDDQEGEESAGDESTSGSSGGNGEKSGPFVDENGRKWVTREIPYDVWHQDPLAVARIETPAGAGGGTGTDPVVSPKVADPPPTLAPGGGPDWKEVVTAELLDNELKKIANRLREKLQTLGTFNRSYLELPPHVATMAAVACIAAEHPGDIRWKKNAKHIRDLSAAMLSDKLMQGAKSYKQINEPYLQISDILSGSPPTGLPEPVAGNEMVDFAEMGLLMKRLEIGEKWLSINVGTADALKENAADVKHEAGLLAALVTAVTTESYGNGDDEDFRAFAQGMIDSCRKVSEAADAANFDNYQLAFSQIGQACQKCHSIYK